MQANSIPTDSIDIGMILEEDRGLHQGQGHTITGQSPEIGFKARVETGTIQVAEAIDQVKAIMRLTTIRVTLTAMTIMTVMINVKDITVSPDKVDHQIGVQKITIQVEMVKEVGRLLEAVVPPQGLMVSQ